MDKENVIYIYTQWTITQPQKERNLEGFWREGRGGREGHKHIISV